MIITSSELVRYNANTRGNSVGDCSARAISLAFNIEYSKARKLLNKGVKYSSMKYNSMSNIIKVIYDLGGGFYRKVADKRAVTVGDWVDENFNGTYIIDCNKSGDINNHHNGHLVCAVDGKLYDSWDSRNYYVLGYWEIDKGIHSSDLTDIQPYLEEFFSSKNPQYWSQYINRVFEEIIHKNRKLKKLADQYNIDIDISIKEMTVNFYDYTFIFKYSIFVDIDDWHIHDKMGRTKMGITFKPTMAENEIESYFDTSFYDKLYWYLHAVVDKVEDICKGRDILSSYEVPQHKLYMYGTISQRSYNTLPYWVRKLATEFRVSDSFQEKYSDSIELRMLIPPFDTEFNYEEPTEERTFYSYSMDDLRKGLEHYKNTGDYERSYELAADYF